MLAISLGGVLTSGSGERPRELNWSSLTGALGLFILPIVCVHVCIKSMILVPT